MMIQFAAIFLVGCIVGIILGQAAMMFGRYLSNRKRPKYNDWRDLYG